MLPGSGLSCAFLDELLNYSGLPLSQLLSRYDHSPYLSHEQIKCIKPVPNRQWSLSLCQELLLWLFGAFSECSDAWSNLGKWALWFMSGSSLTRLNVIRRTGCQASLFGEEWLRLSCLSNCALKSTEQVAAFCRSLHEMKPSDPSPSPQDCTGPQLAALRQLTDADKLRKVICELLETERTYVKVRLPLAPCASCHHLEGCMLGVYTQMSADDKARSRSWRVSCLSCGTWPWFWMLQFPSVF